MRKSTCALERIGERDPVSVGLIIVTNLSPYVVAFKVLYSAD